MRRPGDAAPAPPARSSRYGWFVGIAVFVILVYVTINTLRTEGPGSRGVEIGRPLPPFAVPVALSDLEGDANVAREPGQREAGSRPACDVRGPRVLNVCELSERGPVVLGFLATRGGECLPTVDRLDSLRSRHPGLQVAAVSIAGDRDDLRKIVRERRWRLPVGHDEDGVLANLYGVAVCPHVTFASWGGITQSTAIGGLSPAELERRADALIRDARAEGWKGG